MRAFQVLDHGAPPALGEIERPRPGPGEVLLRIEACGVNFADLLMAQGRYQDTPKPPFTLGMEVCGTVTERGGGVTSPVMGERVAVFGGAGGLAEEGVFLAARCRPVPPGMSSEVAAGFQVAYGTSHLALTRRARLKPGETLAVFGAAGGVGLAAVEVGAAMGARVIAVARGADKLEVARAAGAHDLIDSEDGDLKARLKALGGIDVACDPVGGASFDAALGAMNREGRIVIIGFASGEVPQVPTNIVMVKNVDVIGFYWGGYLKFAPDALTESLADLMLWHEQGRLAPHLSQVLPLDRAGEALDLLRTRTSTGKVVVTP